MKVIKDNKSKQLKGVSRDEWSLYILSSKTIGTIFGLAFFNIFNRLFTTVTVYTQFYIAYTQENESRAITNKQSQSEEISKMKLYSVTLNEQKLLLLIGS